ncbi:TM2 domain-containing protein [Ancylothrix sp. C2]|uniref:TM2 domain-containing protein n=1 Tax=Ancylothrix sp. D3o TaxID=2953691 RepID=UPI0021BB69D3|nr:TM2 domain-containing protein [Ancylothrix sp. D3o]MCT7950467.1 TM2 domain-containing protein [Ancylothrix sp. D3o]
MSHNSPKSKAAALLLCFFLGVLGIHRFYMGYVTIGVIQLLTGGGFGIWWIIDFILLVLDNLPDSKGRSLV